MTGQFFQVTNIHTYTPVRIALPFLCGVLPGVLASQDIDLFFLLPTGFVLYTLFFISVIFIGPSYRLRWLPGALANIFLVNAGLVSVYLSNDIKGKNIRQIETISPSESIICRIETGAVVKSAYSTCRAKIVAGMDSAGNWQNVDGGILLYFRNDTTCLSLESGDNILVYGKLQRIREPSNPHVFNFNKYLYERNVFYQVYLDEGQWMRSGSVSGNIVRRLADKSRDALLKVFRTFGIEGDEYALISALLLGVTDYLDPETRQEFSNAGATHILSVSGLHVALIYVAAEKILFFLKRGKKSRTVRSILIILFIWCYALVTGLTVSVVRASLMFSLVAAAGLMRRSSWNYNILAVSAFIQTWIDPYQILDIGFQLSYLAVLGIFAFYQPFNGLVKSRNRIINWIWPVLAVSCAAQLTTSPLAMYYFHMFPAYFLITNIIVVPLSGYIIYLSLGLLALASVGLTYTWLALPLKWSIRLLLGSIEWIQSWPGAVVHNIVFSPFQVVLFFLFIVSIYGFFILARRKWAFILTGSVALFMVISLVNQYKQLNNNQITVYDISGCSAIDFFHQNDCLCVCDTVLISNEGKIAFQILPNRVNDRISNVNYKDITRFDTISGKWYRKDGPIITASGKKMIIIGNHLNNAKPERKYNCDILVLRGDKWLDADEIITWFDMGQIVIDGSMPLAQSRKLQSEFEKQSVPVHPVREQGAFVLRW